MSWALVVLVPAEELPLVSATLFEEGALGVEEQDDEVLPMPGTPPLPPGQGRAVAWFGERAGAEQAATRILGEGFRVAELPPPLEVPEQDWSKAWRAHHKPLRVGKRAWVSPPWDPPALAPGEVLVRIDPGMAFGTGAHATTALCLERADELLAERPGADLLDVGTGSGVIALLAEKLGAGRICGTENDPVALRAAAEGAALNGIAPGRIGWELRGPDELPPPWDAPYGIVVANILLNTLVELAPPIARKVAKGGRLVLSGLLAPQGDEAEAAYAAQGLRPAGRAERDGWLRVELERPA